MTENLNKEELDLLWEHYLFMYEQADQEDCITPDVGKLMRMYALRDERRALEPAKYRLEVENVPLSGGVSEYRYIDRNGDSRLLPAHPNPAHLRKVE